MGILDAKVIAGHLTTRYIARRLSVMDRTGSTNEDVMRAAAKGAPHGFAILADSQSKGRGRERLQGGPRSWDSPPGVNLYTSVLLRPPDPPGPHPSIVLAAGVALAETALVFLAKPPLLKWPNDLLWAGRKLAGILVQSAEDYVVVGIGLNVNALPQDFASAAEVAVSLQGITGRMLDRNHVAAVLYDQLEKWYNALISDPDEVYSQWLKYSRVIGKTLEVIDVRGKAQRIVVEGLDRDGFLTGKDPAGRKIVIHAGDVVAIDGEEIPCCS